MRLWKWLFKKHYKRKAEDRELRRAQFEAFKSLNQDYWDRKK